MPFRHLSLEDGLSHSTVSTILQDSRGFLWFGTRDGLNRYDGYEFKVYRHDAAPLRHKGSTIQDICEDTEGDLWVGTSQTGLMVFDRSLDRLVRYEPRPERPDEALPRSVNSVVCGDRGELWLGTEEGLFRMDPDAGVVARYRPGAQRLVHERVTELFEDRQRRLWVGTTAGISVLDPDRRRVTNRVVEPPLRSSDAALANIITEFYQDRAGTIWIGSLGGVHAYEPEAGRFTTYAHDPSDPGSLSQNYVRAITEDRSGRLIVGTENGLDVRDAEADLFVNYRHDPLDPHSLNNDPVYSLLTDAQGNIWVGTYHDGINVHYRRRTGFTHVRPDASGRGLSGSVVRTFMEDSRGRLWIATEDGGLNVRLADGSYRHFRHDAADPSTLLSDNIHGIVEDGQGKLWVGSFGGGLNHLDPSSGRVVRYVHDDEDATSLSSNDVMAVELDTRQRLWVGTFRGGLNRFDPETGTFTHYRHDPALPHSLSDDRVGFIYEDRRGRLWVGTQNGLNRYVDSLDGFVAYRWHARDTTSLTNDQITSVLEDRAGRLWVGTNGGGLNLLDEATQTFTAYGTEDGLPSNHVNSIEEDDAGRLWISTNHGLVRFDAERRQFSTYLQRDGLQSNQFNFTSSLRLSTGELLFGGINGYNRFHPDSLRIPAYTPPVVLTNVRIHNQPVPIGTPNSPLERHISETEHLELAHDEAFVTLSYVALDFAPDASTQYAYRLRGIHDDWHHVKTQRSATYTNLPPGDYTFEVRASNRPDLWPSAGASIQISVLPPVWQTWYAYLFYAGLLAGFLYLFKHYSLINVKRKHELTLQGLERDRERALAEMRLQFFTEVSHEFRTPLTLITAPLETLSELSKGDPKVSRLLNTMRRNTRRLLRLANEVLELRMIDAGRKVVRVDQIDMVPFARRVVELFDETARQKQVTCTFESDRPSIPAWFDPDKLETVLVNLLANAFQHSEPGGTVHTRVAVASGAESGEATVVLSVIDSGPGIAPKDQERIFECFGRAEKWPGSSGGCGIGLFLSRELVELHRGRISVQSEPGRGSTFTVELPLGRDHFSDGEVARTPRATVPQGDGFDVPPRISARPLQEEAAGDGAPAPADDDRACVLVVEDEPELREYICQVLGGTFHVETASGGTAGWEKVQALKPDLVISDVLMPDTDGIELCRRIKEHPPTNDIPVILLTAHRTSVSDQREGFVTGADAYLLKPFHPGLLRAQAQSLIDARALVRQHVERETLLAPFEPDELSPDEQCLRRAVEFVEQNMADPDLDVQAIADALNVSRATAYRKIKQLTGLTLGHFIRSIRLKRAAQLLSQEGQNVAQVTYAVGYRDLTYFRTCFRQEFGVNPSEYAAEHAGSTRSSLPVEDDS